MPGRLLLSLTLTLVSLAAFADDFVLDHVRIVSPGQAAVEDGMVIILGDKIVHAGPRTAFGTGYTVVDCRGLTAYPGFIDAYTRTGLKLPTAPTPPEARNAVEGPLPTMWHENRRGVYADLDVSQYVDAKALLSRHSQGVTTVMLASGRGAFGGLTAIASALESDPAPVLMSQAFEEVGFGGFGGGGGGGGGGYPGSAMARIAFMRQLFIDGEYLLQHPPQDGAEKDAVISVIGDVASGLVRTLFKADSEREIQRAFNLADEFGLKMTLFGTDDAWRHAAELKRRGMGVIAQAAFPREPQLEPNEDPVRRLSDPPQAYRDEQHENWKDQCLAVLKLSKAGIKFAFSSEGDTDLFLENIRRHVTLGMTKDAVLRALTVDAADILGVSDKVGTIEKGKLASLVLFDGDFADAAAKIKMVFVAGKKFETSSEVN